MEFKKRVKYLGFSLMEILIAVFIVGILALATAPIISKQMEKADEYSYFLAYKTVEKMAGQIVALGDPEEAVDAAPVTSLVLPDGTKIANSKNNNFLTYLNIKIKTNPLKKFIASLGDKFASTEQFILSKFVPKSLATTQTQTVKNVLASWDSSAYDEVWLVYQVCNGKQIQKSNKTTVTTTTNEAGEEVEEKTTEAIYFKTTDDIIQGCKGYTVEDSANGTHKHEAIYDAFFGQLEIDNLCLDSELGLDDASVRTKLEDIATFIKNDWNDSTRRPDASSFCNNKYATICRNGAVLIMDGKEKSISVIGSFESESDDEDDDEPEDTGAAEGEEDKEITLEEGEEMLDMPHSAKEGTCTVESTFTYSYTIPAEATFNPDRPAFDVNWCTDNGYTGMINDAAPDNINCVCASGLVESMNNPKVCVSPCTSSGKLPYAKLNNTGICCSTDFDPTTGGCCPEKSVYDPAKPGCVCANGYELEGGVCKLKECPQGSYITLDNVCMVNPPIIKAKRFCEEIDKHWNTSERKCDTFDENAGFNTYTSVYEAATGANGNYLSVAAKTGAFNSIEPNIVFTNGLKLWILGDKAASIPGLSYYDTTISSTQNMCKKVPLTSNTETACKNAGGYFCKSENVCLAMDAQSKSKIGDARTCCSATDMTSLEEAAEASGVDWKTDARAYAVAGFTVFVDINGTKGDGTLWEDVYPFYIASNGTVYPAYPLDGAKSATSTSNMLYVGGNSAKQLPVDVYYYESTEDSRQRMVAYSSVSFARGICSSRLLSKYAPYCLNLGEKYILGDDYIDSNNSICDTKNCFISVRKKLKAF